MALIKLNCDCYVNPGEISEITVNRAADSITVRMKTGIGHNISADYGKGIYQTCDDLIARIEKIRKEENK